MRGTFPRSTIRRAVLATLVSVLCLTMFVAGASPAAANSNVAGTRTVNPAQISFEGATTVTTTLTGQSSIAQVAVDTALILDCSGSMMSAMNGMKDAAKALVDSIDEKTDQTLNGVIGNGSRIALVAYSTTSTLKVSLTPNATNVKSSITTLAANGMTATDLAFNTARVELTRDHPENKKVIILFTDGAPNNVTLANNAALAARNAGIEVFCIGLGSYIQRSYLNNWATDPDAQHVFVSPTTAQLQAIFTALAESLVPAATEVVFTDVVNPDFTVSNASVSKGAVEQQGNTLTWTIPMLGTETVTMTYAATHVSTAPCGVVPVSISTTYSDAQANSVTMPNPTVNVVGRPTLVGVAISSNNPNPAFARVGSTVSLYITANEAITTPTVVIAGGPAAVTGAGAIRTATRTLDATDAQGPVTFSISNYSNLAGVAGLPVNSTTNGSSVLLDKTPPTVTASAKTADGAGYLPGTWTKQAVTVHYVATDAETGAATVTPDQVVANEGVITSTLGTAIDNAGNQGSVAFGPIMIDRTAPVITLPANATVEATGIRTAVAIGSATASDVSPVTISSNAPADYPIGDTAVVWTATDAAGNVATATHTVTVRDTTKPVITAPANKTAEATGQATVVDAGQPVVSDIFPVTVTRAPNLNAYPLGETIVTWTATDANGNAASVAQTITLRDTTAPVITVPADATAEATGIETPVSIGQATATDVSPVAITNDAPATYPMGTTTVTWTATDAVGNKSTGIQRVNVVDTTAPAIVAPADVTAEATALRTPVTIGQATATDISGAAVTSDAPADYALGTTTVTWTATDAHGNKATATQKVTVVDTTAPAITAPAAVTAEATALQTPVVIGQATATDIFGATVTSDAPADYALGVTTVTWTATDANGNKATATQKVTVVDTTAPAITAPAAVTAEATALQTPVAIGQASTTDIYPVVVTTDAPAAGFALGTTTVTWTATDANGNKATATQTVTVVDTTAPVVAAPADVTAEATALQTPVIVGQATATDIFGATVQSDAPADYPLGATTVTWTATDANGNKSTATQTVTVVDTTAPVVTVPADVTAEAIALQTPVVIGQATATDIFGATVTSDAPADYTLGITTVTWTATDANGNKSTATQTVTVVDTTAPAVTVPADVTTEATALQTPVTVGEATATDIYDVTVQSDAPVDYPLGTTTVTWTATDANGNKATATQKVTVVDTTAPAITAPAAVTTEATAVQTPVAIGQATATDIFPVTVTSDAPAAFALGATTVTWTARDGSGNTASATQTVTVIDTTAPIVAAPTDVTAEATGPNTVVGIGQATATDIFGAAITSDAPASYPLGTTVVTWTACDPNGNSASATQNVTVRDTTPPVVTAPADKTVEADAIRTKVEIGQATATDPFPVTIVNDGLADYPVGTTLVTWTATDANGNTATAVQAIVVTDTTKPVLTVPADVRVDATGDATVVEIGKATATDIFPVRITSDAPETYPIGTTTVTWTAEDSNGNIATATQRVTVEEIEATVVVGPDTLSLKSNGSDNSVTAYIELELGYDVSKIDVRNVSLIAGQTTISAELKPTSVGDNDKDGVLDRMVKFSREQLTTALAANGDQMVKVTVHGALTDGRTFVGTAEIRVTNPPAKGK